MIDNNFETVVGEREPGQYLIHNDTNYMYKVR